ncbi:MAG: glucose-1-phosphate adenylyltransferase [Gammaproteobacteria bacterium]|nr:MAG: glucose-1-phosphate adenylyltransferase [Gammaproteobacteria bacterium]PIE37255.1 MAG: glucose-1-phosphate adenylyltransferase [Gammaproteobacteria bacterium]
MAQVEERNISRLTPETVALILAGGQGSRLRELTTWRAKPAVPFGGKFRIIDFALSNCINSGVRQIGVATQYKAHSLIRHIIRGWSGLKAELDEFVEIWPASQRDGERWYEGTADAVYQNLDIIRNHNPRFVMILGGDHIYKMDYGPMIQFHHRNSADMTVCCVETSVDEARGAFGVVRVDENWRVLEFQEKPEEPAEIPGKPGRVLASMGNYVFNIDTLCEQVITDHDDPNSENDFGKNLVPRLVESGMLVQGFALGDDRPGEKVFWRDVGTLDSYWEANMELVELEPDLDLYDEDWPIYTYQVQLPAAKFVHDEGDRRGSAVNSLISGGCIVSGAFIEKSLLFSDVHVHSYSHVAESVILPGVDIGRHCTIRRAIIDKGTRIPEGTRIGVNHDEDRERGFRVSEKGVTLVTPDMLGQDQHQFS